MGFRHQGGTPSLVNTMEFYRCHVTAADSGFWERVSVWMAHPPTTLPCEAIWSADACS